MTDMWVTASADHEAEDAERKLTLAMIATAPIWGLLAKAASKDDYANRKALQLERIEASCAQIVPEPAAIAVLTARVLDQFDHDFHLIEGAKAAVEAKRKTSSVRKCRSCGAQVKVQLGQDDPRDHKTACPEQGDFPGRDEQTAKEAALIAEGARHHTGAVESKCQFCGEDVHFSRTPADAAYAAFVHSSTGKTACPEQGDFPGRDKQAAKEAALVVEGAMSRSHYVHIANTLAAYPGNTPELAHHFADHLEDTNPSFDRSRFIDAATHGAGGNWHDNQAASPRYSANHYETLAKAISTAPAHTPSLAGHFADALQQSNPRFNRRMFIDRSTPAQNQQVEGSLNTRAAKSRNCINGNHSDCQAHKAEGKATSCNCGCHAKTSSLQATSIDIEAGLTEGTYTIDPFGLVTQASPWRADDPDTEYGATHPEGWADSLNEDDDDEQAHENPGPVELAREFLNPGHQSSKTAAPEAPASDDMMGQVKRFVNNNYQGEYMTRYHGPHEGGHLFRTDLHSPDGPKVWTHVDSGGKLHDLTRRSDGSLDARGSLHTADASADAYYDLGNNDKGGGCSQCGGPLMEMGQLGNRTHYRCRNCGAETSYPADNEQGEHQASLHDGSQGLPPFSEPGDSTKRASRTKRFFAALTGRTAGNPYTSDNPFKVGEDSGGLPESGPEDNMPPGTMPQTTPMTSKPRTKPADNPGYKLPQMPVVPVMPDGQAAQVNREQPGGGASSQQQRPVTQGFASKVAQVANGILETNPSMPEQQALHLAARTVERFPAMVVEAAGTEEDWSNGWARKAPHGGPETWGDYVKPDGAQVRMHRGKGNVTRFYDQSGAQHGPDLKNVKGGSDYAAEHDWMNPDSVIYQPDHAFHFPDQREQEQGRRRDNAHLNSLQWQPPFSHEARGGTDYIDGEVLTACPQCGTDAYSAAAKTCRHCGYLNLTGTSPGWDKLVPTHPGVNY